MKSAIFEKAGLVTVEEVAKPSLQADDDVIIKVVRACVCGSDLWSYAHGDNKEAHSVNDGHEALGIVEEIGSAITTVKPGDFVIVPFTPAVVNVMLVVRALTGLVIVIKVPPIGLMASSQNIFASITAIGHW